MKRHCYDVIVIGTGGIGSAALMHLASRGCSVLGIDPFAIAHPFGSSHGHTRLIRQAYFEDPAYVPLVLRAYELWHQLEHRANCELLLPTGLIQVGPPKGVVIQGVLAAASQHGLDLSQLDPREARKQYPGLRFPDDLAVVFESAAGQLLVERCVATNHAQAVRLGAEQLQACVTRWRKQDGLFHVETTQSTVYGKRLLVCSGAWTSRLMENFSVPLRILQKSVHWFRNSNSALDCVEGCPAFFYELPHGQFYGFPNTHQRGLKIAEHTGGLELHDPARLGEQTQSDDRSRVESFAKEYVNDDQLSHLDTSHCMYTMTTDSHFLVDRSPDDEDIWIAAGFSGHGFKFAPAIGEALSQWIVDGQPQIDLDFLSIKRLQAS